MMQLNPYWIAYRVIMRLAHRYHWHYAPPIYPEGDTQLWCKWCGFRETIKRRGDVSIIKKAADPPNK
jgi:hypothetical protein